MPTTRTKPAWTGFAFNPDAPDAWHEAVRRFRLGHGEALGTMLKAGTEVADVAIDALREAAVIDPRPARRPTQANATAHSWPEAIRLHEGGNRIAVPSMLGAERLTTAARRYLAEVVMRAARPPKKAPREIGSASFAAALYAKRKKEGPIAFDYAEELEWQRQQPRTGRDATPDARAIEAVAERRGISEAMVRRVARPERKRPRS